MVSDYDLEPPSNSNKHEQLFITHIRATKVVSSLRRMPAGFYASIQVNEKTTKTSNRPVSVREDMVEWDESILLLSERSATVSVRVYASFELGPSLGNGQLLGHLEITVGDLLDRNEHAQPIWPLVQRQIDVLASCSSIEIITDRRICEFDKSVITLDAPESNTTNQLERLTDIGHRHLLRYQQLETEMDLDEAIRCFERAQDMCPPGCSDFSTVQFNLATAKFVRCKASSARLELDVPIALYRNALQLRSDGHPDHCATALSLSFALLDRFCQRGDEADRSEVKVLIARVMELSTMQRYACRAATFLLQMADIPALIQYPHHVSQTEGSDHDDDEAIQTTRLALLDLSSWDSRRPVLFATLGTLLLRRFSRNGKLDDIDEAISYFQNALELRHPDRQVLLNHLGSALFIRFERLEHPSDIDKSIATFEEAERLTPSGHSQRPVLLNNLAKSMLNRFERFGDLMDINRAVSVSEEAVHLTLDDCPEKLTGLNILGCSLSRRFERLGDLEDINKSILTLEGAVQRTPSGHSEEPASLKNLGTSLLNRFVHLGDFADVNRSISTLEKAVLLTPDEHPQKPARLNNLGNSLIRRFERLGDILDIHRSISMYEQALNLTPDNHALKLPRWNNLGAALLRRFEHLGDVADLDKAVSVQEEAVHGTPDGHPDKPSWLANLGNSLLYRFERIGDLADINKSVSITQEAVRLTPDGHLDKPAVLNSLRSSLSARFERLGNIADITESIFVEEEALRLTPDGHPDKPARFNNLGISLQRRFKHLGDLTDIRISISMLEKSVYLTPDGHPEKPAWLSNLGYSLFLRFESLGDLDDLDKSISMREEAMSRAPDIHPDKPRWLNGLASSLLRRFDHLGDLQDINRSILLYEEAVKLTPVDHPNKPGWLTGLGASMLRRFERLGDPADMNMSILVLEGALNLIPNDHPNKSLGLNNLANALSCRFKHLGDPVDVDRSIFMLMEAARLTVDSHPEKPAWLNSLARSLSYRFDRLKDVTDIHKSIRMLELAIHLTPNGHPDRPVWLTNLGFIFLKHFEHTRDPSSLSAATLHFSKAARSSTGSTSSRFRAAQHWILCSRLEEGDSQALLDAYATAIELVPQLAWVGLSLTERHRVLLDAADIARDAAAAALNANRPEMAVEWLEQGRSVIWGQFLQLRTPVDDLRDKHPGLAERFQQVSRELEHTSATRENDTFRQLASDAAFNTHTVSLEKGVQGRHHLALTREKLLGDIRSLPGFERFLRPKTVEQLAASIRSGPVVYLNASKQRCDALIVMAESGNVIPVPLPEISYQQVEELQSLLRLMLERNRLIISRDDISALTSSREDDPTSLFSMLSLGDGANHGDRAVKAKPQRSEGYEPDDLFRQILSSLWVKVADPVLQALHVSILRHRSEKKTRILWCPTGPFTFLPIHAAGLYGTSEPGTKLSDSVISSYIPSISALAPSTLRASNCPSKIRLVTVPQSPTDGLKWLPLVNKEIDHIKALSALSPFVSIEDSDSTVTDVMEKMSNCDWIHFACHGMQDPHKPLESGLCLADGRRLKLSDIIRLSRPRSGLAFLSACQTAQGDEKLPEESVHLAAGMLLAGYGGVIATMWAIMDDDAPRVTQDVYGHLFRDGKVPDAMEAAEALHDAVRRLRDSGVSFSSWVPFIHLGGQ